MNIENVRITDKHVFFWGSVFSNWTNSYFKTTVNGKEVSFANSEQYFMYMKAITFGDEESASAILIKGTDPKTAKDLGRLVKNYDDEKWNAVRFDVMKEACLLKFSQNKELKKIILSDELKGRGFVEGSPVDRIWGIGQHWKDASDDESTWEGQNLLGKALDYVRERLQND